MGETWFPPWERAGGERRSRKHCLRGLGRGELGSALHDPAGYPRLGGSPDDELEPLWRGIGDGDQHLVGP